MLGALTAVARMQAIGYYKDQQSAHESVATKRAAAAQYIDALEQMSAAHHAIVTSIHNGSPQTVIGIVNGFIATYSAKLAAIKKAFT
jgi:hypothetical protein